MTLKGHYALYLKTHASFGAQHENLNEDRPTQSMTLDSGGYSREFPGDGASNNSGVIENVDFRAFGRYVFGTLGNEASIIIFSTVSPFH